MGLWWSMIVYGFIALQRSEHPWVSPRPRPRRPNGRADGSRYLDSEGIQISTSWAWLQIWKPHGILIVIIVYGFEMLTNINEHQWNSMNITLSLQFHWPYPGKKLAVAGDTIWCWIDIVAGLPTGIFHDLQITLLLLWFVWTSQVMDCVWWCNPHVSLASNCKVDVRSWRSPIW